MKKFFSKKHLISLFCYTTIFFHLGGNPLPNFITADYTMKIPRVDQDGLPAPGKIIFVSTDQTENFFHSILNLLKKRHQSLFFQSEETKLGSDHRSPDFIRKKIINVLKNNPGTDSIHLNYTGGTKPMAVNSVIRKKTGSGDLFEV